MKTEIVTSFRRIGSLIHHQNIFSDDTWQQTFTSANTLFSNPYNSSVKLGTRKANYKSLINLEAMQIFISIYNFYITNDFKLPYPLDLYYVPVLS